MGPGPGASRRPGMTAGLTTLRRPLVVARGLRLIRFSFNAPREGKRSAEKRGGLRGPRGGCEPPRHACEACRLPFAIREGAPLGALLRLFSVPGHAFGGICAAISQLLAGGS